MKSSFLDQINLSQAFQYDYKGDNLLYYYSLPFNKNLNAYDEFTNECFELLKKRASFSELSGYAPQDTSIFKIRFDILSTNNEAYTLAAEDFPMYFELERLAMIHASWAWLFPIKTHLHHNLDKAKKYRGLLPMGKNVIAFLNKVLDVDGSERKQIKGQPTLKDHIDLMNISNRMADLNGVPSITINDRMYMIGGKILASNFI